MILNSEEAFRDILLFFGLKELHSEADTGSATDTPRSSVILFISERELAISDEDEEEEEDRKEGEAISNGEEVLSAAAATVFTSTL